MNVAEALLRADSGAPAVVATDRVTSYGELAEASGRLAAALAERGLRPTDRVALVLGNTVAHVVAYFGVLRAGGVAASINPAASPVELAAGLAVARPRVVVAAGTLVSALRPVVRALPTSPLLVADEPVDGALALADLLWGQPPQQEPVARDLADPAALLFTSGSTGRPKGVVLSHGNVGWAARAQAATMPAGPGGVTALAVPLHHCYGQNAVLNASVRLGAAVALLDPRRKRWLLADLHSLGVSALPSVPPTFRLLLDLGAAASALPRLRYAVSAAAELPRTVAQEWLRRFSFPIHEGYGLTETSPCALYNDQATSAPGCLGAPFPGVSARVVDDGGREVPDGIVGVLHLSGPNVMQGYFEDPGSTAAVLRGGWLSTGDCVRRDARGDFWMVGREKSVIVVGGAKVFPAEVESVVTDLPDVVEAAVVGRPHAVLGETVAAFLATRSGARWDEVVRAARERCRARLSPYKRPKAFRQVAAVPRLASGKPDLAALRRLAAEPAARAPGHRSGTATPVAPSGEPGPGRAAGSR